MYSRYRALLIAALLLAPAFALAQGFGLSMGIDDLRHATGGGGPPSTCGTLVLDFSDSCNMIEAVTVGVAR